MDNFGIWQQVIATHEAILIEGYILKFLILNDK